MNAMPTVLLTGAAHGIGRGDRNRPGRGRRRRWH